jgi:hypothetical protein
MLQYYCKFTYPSLNLQSSVKWIVSEDELTCKVPTEAVHIPHLLACPAERKCLQKYLSDYKSTAPEADIYANILIPLSFLPDGDIKDNKSMPTWVVTQLSHNPSICPARPIYALWNPIHNTPIKVNIWSKVEKVLRVYEANLMNLQVLHWHVRSIY